MTTLNKRILEEIEKSDNNENIKSLLRTLLLIEYGRIADSRPIYSAEYDKEISDHLPEQDQELEED